MTEVVARATAHSAAPPEAVWQALADGKRWREWNDAVAWVVVEGDGSAGDYVTIKPKRGRQTAYRIADSVPGRSFALLLTFGPMAALRQSWAISPDGTGARIEATIETSGPLARWLVARIAQRTAAALPDRLAALAQTV